MIISFLIQKIKQFNGLILFYPLVFAFNNHWYILGKLLISFGANIHYALPNGNTLLHEAISRREAQIVKLLINAGFNANTRNNWGQLPLEIELTQIAKDIKKSMGVNYSITKLLLAANAELELPISPISDEHELSLFFYAIKLNLPEIVSLFLKINPSLAKKILPEEFTTDVRIINIIAQITDAENIMKIDPRYFFQETILPNYGTFDISEDQNLEHNFDLNNVHLEDKWQEQPKNTLKSPRRHHTWW